MGARAGSFEATTTPGGCSTVFVDGGRGKGGHRSPVGSLGAFGSSLAVSFEEGVFGFICPKNERTKSNRRGMAALVSRKTKEAMEEVDARWLLGFSSPGPIKSKREGNGKRLD